MHVIRLKNTTYGLKIANKTVFMVFKNKKHANMTQNYIKNFIMNHRTLPMMTGEKAVPLVNPNEWIYLLQELRVKEISNYELHNICELCNAGYFHIDNYELSSNEFSGEIYDGPVMDLDNTKRYLENLL